MPILFATVIIIMGSFAMLLPSIMYVLANMGVSTGWSTPIIAAYSLAQFVAGPQWGRLSDRIGRKKVLLMALVGASASYGFMSHFAGSVLPLFVTMIGAGFCAGALAVVFAAVADLTDADNRTKGMGMVGAGIGLAFVVGTAIGGSIAGDTSANATLVAPAAGSSIASFSGFLLVLFLFRETKKENSGVGTGGGEVHHASRFAAFRRVARHPALIKLCFLILGFTFCLALMEPLIPRYIDVFFGWGPIEMRNIFIFIGVILVLVQGGLVGPLAKRFGEQRLVQAGLVMMGAGLLSLALFQSTSIIYGSLLLTSIGTAIFNASSLALASHEALEHEKGAIMGVVQSMQALGRSFGPLVTGLLFDIAYVLPFWIGGTLVILLFFWLLSLLRQIARDHSAA